MARDGHAPGSGTIPPRQVARREVEIGVLVTAEAINQSRMRHEPSVASDQGLTWVIYASEPRKAIARPPDAIRMPRRLAVANAEPLAARPPEITKSPLRLYFENAQIGIHGKMFR